MPSNPDYPVTPTNQPIGFLSFVNGSTPTAALWQSIITRTNAALTNVLGWAGIATHVIGYNIGASVDTEPGVLGLGHVRASSSKTTGTLQAVSLDPTTGGLITTPSTGITGGLYIRPGAFPTWNVATVGSPDTANNITKTGSAGQNHYLLGYIVSIKIGAPTSDIVVDIKADNTTLYWSDIIGAASARGTRIGAAFAWPGIQFPSGQSINLNASTPGTGGIVITSAMYGYTLAAT